MVDIKVTKNVGSDSKTTSTIEIDVSAPAAIRRKINEEVGQYLVEQTIKSMSQGESPVDGGDWDPKLDPRYRKKKIAEGGSGKPDLELTGALKDAITFDASAKAVEYGVWGEEAAKADGHNHFSAASAHATAPRRQFLPEEGQDLDASIMRGIEEIVADNLIDVSNLEREKLGDVTTQAELYSVLQDAFGDDLTRSELRAAALRSEELTALLEELDLLDLL